MRELCIFVRLRTLQPPARYAQVFVDGAPGVGGTDGWQALLQLTAGSELVITESMPVPPEAAWLSSLAAQLPSRTALWAVDTACIVPTVRVMHRYAKAYQYRHAAPPFAADITARPPAAMACRWEAGARYLCRYCCYSSSDYFNHGVGR